MVQQDGATGDNIIRRMRSASWITKVTDTHSEHVIIVAFQRQQWSRERAAMLHYTYVACLVQYIHMFFLVHLVCLSPHIPVPNVCLSVGHTCHLRNVFAVSIRCDKLLRGAALTVVKKNFYPVDRDIIFFRNVGIQLTDCAI
jgi:hypothetical protein